MNDFPVVLEKENDARKLLLITYGLFIAGWVTSGFTALIAIIICYVKRREYDQTWLSTHVAHMIYTFWMSAVFFMAGVLLWTVFLGVFIMMGLFVWNLVRLIKGALRLNDKMPIEK